MGRNQKAGEQGNKLGYTSWVAITLTTGRLSKNVAFGYGDHVTVWSLFGVPLMMLKNCIAGDAAARGRAHMLCVQGSEIKP